MNALKLKLPLSKLALSMLMVMGLIGCINPSPVLDDNFGNAVNAAKAQQTLNPDAGLTNQPIYGVDGDAATAAIETYRESYVSPEETSSNVFNIGVGTKGGSTGN